MHFHHAGSHDAWEGREFRFSDHLHWHGQGVVTVFASCSYDNCFAFAEFLFDILCLELRGSALGLRRQQTDIFHLANLV